MKLSAETKTALQALDYEYGGGVSTAGIRTDIIDKPILILGLGGTGAESLIRIKHAIGKQFKSSTDNIEYMAIDSDDNMKKITYANTSFTPEEFLCLETANLTSIYKNRDTVFKNSTQSWMADNLRLQQVKHGAGGIRQAGRLLLTVNCNRAISMLSEKINRLTANRNTNDLLYVFITTGAAGGTGSGIFIDVPYIIRKIASQKGFEVENIGMIFMPDVTLSDTTIDGSAALNIKANGFAALKELDYLMNLENNGEFFEQTYADLEIKTNQPPYDLCHLVSAKDEQGKLAPMAKDYCMNVAAETIINFIANEEVADGQSYTISSYLSNIENNRAAFIMTHQVKQPVNYIYNAVGASSAILPIEYLLNYLTYNMFTTLDKLTDNIPSFEESLLMLESFKIDLPALERHMNLDKPKVRDFNQYNYAVLQQRPDILDDAVKKELSKLTDYYNEVAKNIIEKFSLALEDKGNTLLQHFADLETGPFYILKSLSPLHESSLIRTIDTIRKNDLQQKRENRDNIAALELSRQLATEKLRKKSAFALGKKSQATQLVEINENYLRLLGKNLMYDAIDNIYNSITEILNHFNDVVVDTYCELLTAFRELFEKFKDTKIPSAISFSWNLEDTHTFCQIFDDNTTIDYRLMFKRFLQSLVYDSGWEQGPTGTIVENLNAFVSEQFQAEIHRSLDYYSNMVANSKEITLSEYVTEKVNTLQDSAKIMFPINHIPSGLHITFPPYAYLSIPSNAPRLTSAIQELGGKVPNIKYSRMNNRLYMLNLKIAIPLYCYKELNDYETVYETSLSKIPGIHLYESATLNWKNLPSPNYDLLWTNDHDNARERMKNSRLREIFDQAIELGIIRHDSKRRRLVGYFGDPVNLEKKFAKLDASIQDRTLSASQARAMIAELNAFLASSDREKYSRPLYDTEYITETDMPNIEYAKGIFIYMPAFNQHISQEVEMRQYISHLQNELTKIDLSEVKYSNFAQLLYMGAIAKNRKNYRYSIDSEFHILYTMQTITEQYTDYEVFQAYLNMDESIAAYLQKRAVEEENRCTDAEFKTLVKTIDTYIKTYKEKLEQLEESYTNERDGALKKLFYKTMLNVFIQEKKVLS